MEKQSRWKKIVDFIVKYMPIQGGYSLKDLEELDKDPDNYNYRGNSWAKKMEDTLLHKKKKRRS
jgi:hypothetical protein